MLDNIAQKIATTASEVINHDVLITDKDGKVLGSSDISRIGTWHQASIEIITLRTERTHNEQITKTMIGVKPGITLPIELSDELIGTIGITGNPIEVKKFGLLVKKYAELFLKEELFNRKTLLKEMALQNLVQDIASYNSSYYSDELLFLTRGKELGYDLKLRRVVIVIDLFQFNDYTNELFEISLKNESPEILIQSLKLKVESNIRSIFSKHQDLSVSLESDKFIVFHHLDETTYANETFLSIKVKCDILLEKLKTMNIEASIGVSNISNHFQNLSKAYHEAWNALRIGKKLNSSPGIYFIKDYYIEDFLTNIHTEYSTNFVETSLKHFIKQPHYEDLFQTIVIWCESNLNFSIAAEKLNLHRNTLLYRLKKIEEYADVDLKNFSSVLKLYIAIKLFYLNQKF